MPVIVKKNKRAKSLPVILLIAFSCFTFFALQINRDTSSIKPEEVGLLSFTLPAEIQILLFAGDRYLAANIQFISTIGNNTYELTTRANAHKAIADLNPCYEDNLYFSNAFLSWGGLPKEGNRILEQSTTCRTWDDIPPFFLGFNRYFFFRDRQGAQESMKLAIDRSHDNKVALKRLYIAIESEKFDDRKLALAYLQQEWAQADSTELKNALHVRIGRLNGLVILDKAQRQFEEKFQRPLERPQELIEQGIIKAYPTDPLGVGYEFRDRTFHFREVLIQ